MQGFHPETESQAADVVRAALSENQAIQVTGNGSKQGWGAPVAAEVALGLSALSGIECYEPEELVLTAKAGTAMAEIEQALTEKDQTLAFEPPDLGPLYGGGADSGTLGGIIACNLSGPARIRSGAARDHVLGLDAIGGRGEIFHCGGRVVKNVTGFDLPKVMAGSFGTLGVMTSITVRALPRAEKLRTVLIFGLDWERAGEAMGAALRSPHDINGAAHLSAGAAALSQASYVSGAGQPVTALRIEGPGPSAAARCAALRALLAPFGETEELHGHNSGLLWREVRDVAALLPAAGNCIWRLSVPPASGAVVTETLIAATGAEAFMDWGGGLIWLSLAPGLDAGAGVVRAAIAECGGHATLMRAPEALRAAVPVFQPGDAITEQLAARLKGVFDPAGIFNPGRMNKAA
jgi:glycolate oxidase FAD binding subunit